MFGIAKDQLEATFSLFPIRDYGKSRQKIYLKYFLWYLYFLRNYSDWEVCAVQFREPESTYRIAVKKMVNVVKGLDIIGWEDRLFCTPLELDDMVIYTATDTTDVPVNFYTSWGVKRSAVWSTKNHQYSVKFEVASDLDGNIVWVYGPFFHSYADITIFRNSLEQNFLANEATLGDKAYIGSSHTVCPYKKENKGPELSNQQVLYNNYHSSFRAIIENVNATLKQWGILRGYRGVDLGFLAESFLFICNMIQLKKNNFQD